MVTASGERIAVTAARANYQSVADGGCSTGRTEPEGDGAAWRQTTGVSRTPAP
jgi:hypothetical protein